MPNLQPELERGAFRAWLASLPPNRRVLREGQDLFERFLRANGGGRRAGLVETFDAHGNSEGWQHYRAGSVEEETPGLFFYAYDLYPLEGTGAEMLAWWDAYCADWDAGGDGESVDWSMGVPSHA